MNKVIDSLVASECDVLETTAYLIRLITKYEDDEEFVRLVYSNGGTELISLSHELCNALYSVKVDGPHKDPRWNIASHFVSLLTAIKNYCEISEDIICPPLALQIFKKEKEFKNDQN